MKIYSFAELKGNGKNRTFFNNAKFHGDYKYEIDSKNRILTVFCKDFDNNKRIVKYNFDEKGTIGFPIRPLTE